VRDVDLAQVAVTFSHSHQTEPSDSNRDSNRHAQLRPSAHPDTTRLPSVVTTILVATTEMNHGIGLDAKYFCVHTDGE
jgi:hypothetical protein